MDEKQGQLDGVAFIPGKIGVIFNPNVGVDRRKKILQELGLSIVKKSHVEGFYLISVPDGSEMEWIAKLEKLPEVRLATLEYFQGHADKIWIAMAIVGCVLGAFFSITTLAVITGMCILLFGIGAWVFAQEYGWMTVSPGVAWWAGMFLVPMWTTFAIRWIIAALSV